MFRQHLNFLPYFTPFSHLLALHFAFGLLLYLFPLSIYFLHSSVCPFVTLFVHILFRFGFAALKNSTRTLVNFFFVRVCLPLKVKTLIAILFLFLFFPTSLSHHFFVYTAFTSKRVLLYKQLTLITNITYTQRVLWRFFLS